MTDCIFRQSFHPPFVMAIVLAALASSCAPRLNVNPKANELPRLAAKHYVSYDNDQLGYRKWLPEKAEPKTVIIGVHGISGHAGDYENIAKHLLKHHSDVALYAPETRGQGMDPNKDRRGDIRRVKEWYKDLYTFTRLIRKVHPHSKIVWFGESMGSLIIMHAYDKTPPGEQRPDALIVSAPIVDVKAKLPAWKMMTVRVLTMALPKLRVSLETLAGGERQVVTEDDVHEEQAAKNTWYIPRYTLRLLLNLGDMAGVMEKKASKVQCPVLVLHGGKDVFTEKESVDRFYQSFPEGMDKTKKFYPDSYHLLMYDHDRVKIFNDVSTWLKKLK